MLARSDQLYAHHLESNWLYKRQESLFLISNRDGGDQ